jgi:hypothetical protein
MITSQRVLELDEMLWGDEIDIEIVSIQLNSGRHHDYNQLIWLEGMD